MHLGGIPSANHAAARIGRRSPAPLILLAVTEVPFEYRVINDGTRQMAGTID